MSVLPNKGLCSKKSFIILCYRSPEPGLKSPYLGLLRGQLDYWFSKKPNGFYKFLEPCNHPLYKAGDSWSEELGISRRVFNAVFDLIGIRYNSKTAYKTAKDKFKGKLYASYHDRKTNKMFYIRNVEMLRQPEKALPLKDTSNPKKICKKRSISEAKIVSNSTNSFLLNNHSSNDTNCRSYGGTIGGINSNSFTENTSSSLKAKIEDQKPEICSESKKIAEEMKNIWIEEIGDPEIVHLSQALISRMNASYSAIFDKSLESWRNYCRKIASSNFLMGEGRGKFKAWLTWAIKPESYERIQAGEFTLGDRVRENNQKILSPHEEFRAQEDIKRELIASSHDPVWIQVCLRLFERVGYKRVKEWLYPLNLVKMNSTEVELQAPNLFMRDWIHKNLIKDITSVFHELGRGTLQQLRITVSSS